MKNGKDQGKRWRKYGKNIRGWGGTQRNGSPVDVEEGTVAQSPWGSFRIRIGMDMEYT